MEGVDGYPWEPSPYLKFDGGILIKSDGLCQERSTNSRFSVVVELILL